MISRKSPLLFRKLAGPVLLLASLWLTACQPFIEVVQPPTTPAGLATVVPADRAVGIIGVDFDPPLEYDQILTNGGVTLLVAIENRGRITESSIEVTARLRDPTAREEAADLLNETVTIRSLKPGEVRVVRFTQVTELPVRERYGLVVELGAVAGEVDLGDNVHSFDIVVRNAW